MDTLYIVMPAYNEEETMQMFRKEGREDGFREANTKTVLNLFKLDKLSIEEIAATVDLSVDKVKELITPKTVQ